MAKEEKVKKYIIITRRVSNMGGAQLFVLRRALHLTEKGYSVCIIVGEHNEYYPLEEKFRNFTIVLAPEIRYCIARRSKKQQEVILKRLLDRVGSADSFFIESHTLTGIEWGELLAARCNAKHLAYPLTEPRVSDFRFQPGKRIFREKLNKGEFYGCTSTSLADIFEDKDVPAHFVNIGFDESELVDTSTPAIDYNKQITDFVITTVSRFEKTYIEHLADATAEIARKHPCQRFVLLIAGGSPNQSRVDYLTNNYNSGKYGLDNLSIKYLGFIHTLGKDFFQLTDVFVGMGTASINAISQQCITINIDPHDGMKYASGFFGIDTRNFAYSETGSRYTIYSKIEEAYLSNDEKRHKIQVAGRRLYEDAFEIKACFKQLDTVINNLRNVGTSSLLNISSIYRIIVRAIYGLRYLVRRT